MDKRVAVIMPCYNSMPYLVEAIESILKQTFWNFDLIAIDDASTDKSLETLGKFALLDSRIKIYPNRYGHGCKNARNYGIDISKDKYEYIAIMDSDDVAPINRLQIEVAFLDENKDIGAVAGNARVISESGEKIRDIVSDVYNAYDVKSSLFFYNSIPNASAMYRNNIVNQYNIRYRLDYILDYLFWCEFSNVSNIVILKDILLNYRVVASGITKTTNQEERENKIEYIHDYMFDSNNIKIPHVFRKVFYKSLRESAAPTPYFEKVIIYFVYALLKQQAINKPWGKEFCKLCDLRRKFNVISKIKSRVKTITR